MVKNKTWVCTLYTFSFPVVIIFPLYFSTDPPKIVRVGPERLVVAALYNRTVLVCQAEGNPPPSYQWLQKTTTADEVVYVRGAEHMLVIHNVTYEYQGKYFCKATNFISGTERTSQSDQIDLSVMGKLSIIFFIPFPSIFFFLLNAPSVKTRV